MRRGFLAATCVFAAAALPASLVVGLVAGCDGRSYLETNPFLDAGPDVTEDADAAPPPPIEVSSKVDLLLVVDNSRNLEVAHQALTETIPYLVDRLLRPACVNGLGNVVGPSPTPGVSCVVGVPDFPPITDLHLAVISTSLGGHGADICSPGAPSFLPPQNDAAHLLSRTDMNGVVPTYQGQGFLSWDPQGVSSPPGDNQQDAVTNKLTAIVHGVGEQGCGFESQLESVYRFLVDPSPYAAIGVVAGEAMAVGVDPIVLKERADFLRPDSALVVLLLTDENDCSTREGGQYYLAGQGGPLNGMGGVFHLPPARSECAKAPQDPCCASCGQKAPAGCPPSEADPACQAPLDGTSDPINLRCYDQKRRFGISFLYPTQRYVDGLTNPTVADRAGDVVPNPLFVGNRSPELVLFGAIVGVPWQDIAKDPKALATGFAPPSEIDWNLVLGDPTMGTPPADPLMVESIAPRVGVNPRTGVATAPPEATSALANPVNGHERTITAQDDLQYACIYPRQAPVDCTGGICECQGVTIPTNPICQQDDGTYSSVQRYVRALPGTRELAVVEALGDRAAVGSVCAPNTVGMSDATFGYKPAVDAVLRTLRRRITPAP